MKWFAFGEFLFSWKLFLTDKRRLQLCTVFVNHKSYLDSSWLSEFQTFCFAWWSATSTSSTQCSSFLPPLSVLYLPSLPYSLSRGGLVTHSWTTHKSVITLNILMFVLMDVNLFSFLFIFLMTGKLSDILMALLGVESRNRWTRFFEYVCVLLLVYYEH